VSRGLSPEELALHRVLRDVREEPVIEPDWSELEARLMSAPRPRARAAASGFFGRFALPSAALLVGAGAALFALFPRHAPVAPITKAIATVAVGPLDGDHLNVGAHVSAGKQSVSVEHKGRARWTLDPGASASISDVGEFLTVHLESGAISASVVPNPKSETFAIEVEGTRVAVHGTAFRVEKTGDHVLVEVTEGTVAVEPASTHTDPSFLLRRGSRGSFGFDGRSGTVEGNASVVDRQKSPQSHRQIAAAPAHPEAKLPSPPATPSAIVDANPSPSAAAPAPALPVQPSIADIEAGVSAAVEVVNGCFRKAASASDIRVTASTGVSLTVAGDGSVQSVTFGPPLAPSVEDCAVAGLRHITFAPSVEGATFTRILELKR